MPSPSGRHTRFTREQAPSRGQLAIRWFTPRGRAAVEELVADLRQLEGRHAREIVAELRRDGLDAGRLDLRAIDLRGEELGGARLAEADLSGARLEGAKLARADLRGARLSGARLREVDLTGADLTGADLTGADLTRTVLAESRLEGVELAGARLFSTDLKRAWAPGVDFTRAEVQGVDLAQVRTVEHRPDPGPRKRQPLGAPPAAEPRPPTRRFRTIPGGETRPARRMPPALPTPSATVGFDRALAELLMARARVGRLVATIDGVEVVLFDREAARRVA